MRGKAFSEITSGRGWLDMQSSTAIYPKSNARSSPLARVVQPLIPSRIH
jgi:hypothetical protein